MATQSVGFVAGGRVVSILLAGWARAGATPGKVVVFDSDADVLARLKTTHAQIDVTSDLSVAAGQDVVFLAVHPPVVKGVLPQVKPSLNRDAVLVSLAPKFTIAKLTDMLSGFDRIVRLVPNAPSAIGKGYNPVAFGQAVGAADRDALKTLFAPLGYCPEVPEEHLEAYAIVSAMGPTYLWFQLQTLRELAAEFGLSPQAADEAILATVNGAAACLLTTEWTPEKVMDMIPVKPLGEHEEAINAIYRDELMGLFRKLST